MRSATNQLQQNERIEILDILRGFALLGIIIANTAVFSTYVFLPDKQQAALFTHPSDGVVTFLLFAFVNGKFYSLFSLLFGIGFTIILENIKNKGKNPFAFYYRRLFVLMIIGLIHLLFLWDGDILLLYALIGIVLPLFLHLPDKTLIILAVILIFSPLLFDLVKVLSDGRYNLGNPFENMAKKIDERNGITDDNYLTYLIDNKNYESIFKWCQGGAFWRYEHILSSNRIPKVLAMFLLGVVAGRNYIHARLDENKMLLKKILKWGFVIGIPSSIAFAYFNIDNFRLPKMGGLLDTLFYAISVIPLSLALTATICLTWLKPSGKILKILIPAGRMALTNYIMQTVINIFIYYGIGLGQGNKFGPSLYVPIAIIIFIIQVWYSRLWLTYFHYGPLEWIWRQLTYGRFMKIKK